MMETFKTVGDVSTLVLAMSRQAVINRFMGDSPDLAEYGTTIEDLLGRDSKGLPEDLSEAILSLDRAELVAIATTGATMVGDLMMALAGNDSEVAVASIEKMMLSIRQQEVGIQ